ncbi:hypothetical protein [Anaerocolumna sp. MB42-C2]|uniref:hypothetical protein n=1 Tax=Anaerocolumna sp. MB42-C2 TaxID=3070997 RepID=UPI0027E0EA24|nr:hypothetical protein [Anaerocolumna sp. MB42-C2]WMJ86484.1 hypothetical protein RBU59_20955 [Anaerocolumna sp. MB42-C2]
MSFNNGFNGINNNESFIRHISRFIGETVTIFTASGGESGSGFTGVILAVNCDFVRLVTDQGSAPATPIDPPYDECETGYDGQNYGQNYDRRRHCYNVGSVTDIPIEKIVAFVHNAV